MPIAYFDCQTGIAGDMTLAALIDAGLDTTVLTSLPGQLGLDNVQVEVRRTMRNGLSATQVHVAYPHEHVHRHLKDVKKIIEGGDITASAKNRAVAIFTRLAAAEARVHGISIEKVHFHEVGALDAIIDITGVAVAWDVLGLQAAYCSRVAVGGGRVKMAHGLYPVPAPATTYLLENFVIEPGPVDKELVTPTGAAILATLAQPAPLPPLRITATGYGAGSQQFEQIPNVLRLIIGETEQAFIHDAPLVLACNIDDMNPQLFPPLLEKLLQAGALDAFLTPVLMKKGRPGFQLTVLLEPALEARLLQIIFSETTTIGIRKYPVARYKLPRRTTTAETSLGPVAVKEIIEADGSVRRAPEFDDCQRLAVEHKLPLAEVFDRLQRELATTPAAGKRPA